MATTVIVPATITRDIMTLPDAVYTTPAPLYTEAPFAVGTRGDCANYVDGSDYQFSLERYGSGSMCKLIAEVLNVGLEELGVWNPGE